MSSLSSTAKLDKRSRLTRLDDITKWARGGKEAEIPLYTETQTDMTFPEATAAAVTAIEAVAADPDNAQLRTEASYAAALARDMKYAAMGKRRLFQLGVHNALRETYEGFKIAHDSEQT
jgi:hypothetical protein